MTTILVVLILFIGIPILIGHIIYFGGKYDEFGASSFREVHGGRVHHRQPPTRYEEEKTVLNM